MSTALAIAGVTAVLRDLLNDGMINHNVSGIIGSTVSVSVLPPDRVVAEGGTESSQLNLFLHQVTPNSGWRNEGLPARDPSGRQRLANPPLALDLHYLISAYGNADLHREILLGYAMQLLHERPVLDRQAIRTALQPSPDVGTTLPEALRALANAGLADQVEQLRITPAFLNNEEMSKLWTAAQSSYRPTAAYQVSVVLIESTTPTRVPLPVLSRGPVEAGHERGIVARPDLIPPLPTLEAVEPAGGQPVAQLGKSVTLRGHHLDGANRQVRLTNVRFNIDKRIPVDTTESANEITFKIPDDRAGDFPVAIYDLSVELLRPGEATVRETNRLPLVLAAELIIPAPKQNTSENTNTTADTAADTDNFIKLKKGSTATLKCKPQIYPGQIVTLILGQEEITPTNISEPPDKLSFIIPEIPTGTYLARLRVDGIDSPIINRDATPPKFLQKRVVIE